MSGPGPLTITDGSVSDESVVQFRFKGVVQHSNGHWGSQIYADHKRIWVGTFKTERDAALAYDRAALKLRSDDLYRNIALDIKKASLEEDFQRGLSKEDVLGMIKEGSYDSHLAEFERKLRDHNATENSEKTVATKMFDKVLTQSDIGKLNRLVIPKKSALKFKDHLLRNRDQEGDEFAEIEFLDNNTKCWRFRFCYWKSSHSYVFTKGWNRFVKLKNLKVGDIVVFNMCLRNCKNKGKDAAFFTIDFQKALPKHTNIEQKESRLPLERVVNDAESTNSAKNIGNNTFRLFGVNMA